MDVLCATVGLINGWWAGGRRQKSANTLARFAASATCVRQFLVGQGVYSDDELLVPVSTWRARAARKVPSTWIVSWYEASFLQISKTAPNGELVLFGTATRNALTYRLECTWLRVWARRPWKAIPNQWPKGGTVCSLSTKALTKAVSSSSELTSPWPGFLSTCLRWGLQRLDKSSVRWCTLKAVTLTSWGSSIKLTATFATPTTSMGDWSTALMASANTY